MALLLKNSQDISFKIIYGVRYCIFVAFSILSIRSIFVSLECFPTRYLVILGSVLLGAGVLSYWKTKRSLYVFVVIIPLISGLQMLGILDPSLF